jgi:hypothetical protein
MSTRFVGERGSGGIAPCPAHNISIIFSFGISFQVTLDASIKFSIQVALYDAIKFSIQVALHDAIESPIKNALIDPFKDAFIDPFKNAFCGSVAIPICLSIRETSTNRSIKSLHKVGMPNVGTRREMTADFHDLITGSR